MAEEVKNTPVTKEDLWYIDNYIVLRDYYDRTISRIAARCVRMGNIAIEEYPFYSYILDVLEEICDTGNFILSETKLHPFVEKKIAGGVAALRKNLSLYQEELRRNSTPEMIKQDPQEISKMKDVLGDIEPVFDPTAGAGMNIDDLMEKLLKENQEKQSAIPSEKNNNE